LGQKGERIGGRSNLRAFQNTNWPAQSTQTHYLCKGKEVQSSRIAKAPQMQRGKSPPPILRAGGWGGGGKDWGLLSRSQNSRVKPGQFTGNTAKPRRQKSQKEKVGGKLRGYRFLLKSRPGRERLLRYGVPTGERTLLIRRILDHQSKKKELVLEKREKQQRGRRK